MIIFFKDLADKYKIITNQFMAVFPEEISNLEKIFNDSKEKN